MPKKIIHLKDIFTLILNFNIKYYFYIYYFYIIFYIKFVNNKFVNITNILIILLYRIN